MAPGPGAQRLRAGVTQFVQVEKYVWVANLIGQRGIRTGSKGVPVRYEAIDTGLAHVAIKAAELDVLLSRHRPVSAAVWRWWTGPGWNR